MADTTYKVVLALETAGDLSIGVNKAAAAMSHAHDQSRALEHAWLSTADTAERAFHRVGDAVEGVADTIMRVAGTAAAAGLGGLFAGAVYGVVSLNNELEQTTISLAAIFNAQGLSGDFNSGFQMAGEQVAKMKQDVKTLPGDLGQLSAIMKTISPSSAQGGLNVDQIRQLAGKTMLVGQIVGVDQALAAREMAELLEGRATSRNKLAQRIGLGGERGKELRHESSAQRVKDIEETLSHYDAATSVFAKSFIANWTTLKDNIKYGFMSDATAPLFDAVKNTIVHINEWFDNNGGRVRVWAFEFGRHLVASWTWVTAEAEKLGPTLDHLGHVFFDLWDRALTKLKEFEPIIDKVAKLLDNTTADDVIHRGKQVVESKVAGIGLNLAGDTIGGGAAAYRMYSMWQLTKKVEKLAAGGAGAAGEAAAGEGAAVAGAAEAGKAAATGGGVAGLAGGAASAAGNVGILAELALLVWGAYEGIKKFSQTVETQHDKDDIVNQSHEQASEAMNYLGGSLDANTASSLQLQGALENLFIRVRLVHDDKPPPIEHSMPGSGELPPHLAATSNLEQSLDYTKRPPPGGGGTNIQKVEIIVKGSDDPSRVARLVLEQVTRIGRNPTRSPYAQNWQR